MAKCLAPGLAQDETGARTDRGGETCGPWSNKSFALTEGALHQCRAMRSNSRLSIREGVFVLCISKPYDDARRQQALGAIEQVRRGSP
eukprot:gene19482-23163_t